LCRECRAESGKPVVTTSCFFARNHGCIGHPAFPAPSPEGRLRPLYLLRRETIAKLGRVRVARTRSYRSSHQRHCEPRLRRSNPALPCCPGLLRGACHRVGIRPTRWLAMTDANGLFET
jgi:hypothetical protein